jgi:hypothetical protein
LMRLANRQLANKLSNLSSKSGEAYRGGAQ